MPPEQLTDTSEEHVTVTLPRRKADLLIKLIDTVDTIDGWCRFNRWLGKWVLIGGLTAVVLLSNAIDGLKNILSSMGKH
jgi:hypothetical protein